MTKEEILERIATSAELREDVFGPRQVDPNKLAELLAEMMDKFNFNSTVTSSKDYLK